MNREMFKIAEQEVIIRLHGRICETPEEILSSALFKEIIRLGIEKLKQRNSYLLDIFGGEEITPEVIDRLIRTLAFLTKMSADIVTKVEPRASIFLKNPHLFNEFVEYIYNYWRSYDRFLISDSTGKDYDQRPYRTFNATIGQLTSLIRGMYRDVQESITGKHPRIYRQVTAGAEVSTIATACKTNFPHPLYEKLNQIPLIRQILLYPPLILNPPMNKRTGKFARVDDNPLQYINPADGEWLCYPAKVGELLIYIYFHDKFFALGHALCNLFELADDADLNRRPDAVYLFGVPPETLTRYGDFPTIFYDDVENNMLVAAVPNAKEFGYFGYLKKMVLTLHNIIMMKKGKMPYHGALVKIILKGGRQATILFIGDTGAGKSETLEALRELAESSIQDTIIIADDMGTLDIGPSGEILGYGTEIGAFLRLDDLRPGYALGQIDRAIIMNPSQANARIILPVTTFENIVKGFPVSHILYANNYDGIDEEHKIIERFTSAQQALGVFREGTVMSKGTTTSTGLVHSYFANIFGPPQYKELHEPLAQKYFEQFMKQGIFVGQMRTRLGLSGWEREGPLEAAKELIALIQQ